MSKQAQSLLSIIFLAAFATGCATNRYKLVWHDEFKKNGPPDPANWNYERGFVRNSELQWYQPENAFCSNGLLVIEARREHKPNPEFVTNSTDWQTRREWIDYTSASITSRRLREFKYGKFEMRARIDTRPGSWPAFWTLGAQPGIRWPACGEVDIMEFYTNTVLANFGYGHDRKTKWLASRSRSPNSVATRGQRRFTSGRWSGTKRKLTCCSTAS